MKTAAYFPRTILLIIFIMSFYACKNTVMADVDKPEIFVQLGHSGNVTSVAFSPDGKYALSGSADHTTKLWDVDTGRLIRTLRGSALHISGEGDIKVIFSPNGSNFLAGSWDGDIAVLELKTGKKVAAFAHGALSSLAFSNDGEQVLSGSYDGTMKLWSITDGKEIRTFNCSSYGVASIAFSPDGKHVLSGGQDGDIQIWDINSDKPSMIYRDENEHSKICSLAFSPDGRRAFAVHSNGNIMIWDILTGVKIRQWNTGAVLDGPATVFGRYVIFRGLPMDTISLWDIEIGKELRIFSGHEGTVDAVAFSSDGKYLLSGGSDKSMKLWDVSTGKELRSFSSRADRATAAAFSPDGNILLSGSAGLKNITINSWDDAHGRRRGQLAAASGFDLAFSPDCRYAFSGGVLWDIEAGRTIKAFSDDRIISTSTFSPDGRYLLSGDHNGIIRLQEVETGKEIMSAQAHKNSISSVVFSPDGQYFATGCKDNTANLKIWSAITGKSIRVFDESNQFISAIAFTPDSKYILSGNPSTNAKLRLWDISTGKVVRPFSGHTNDVYAISISADGKYALSGSRDQTIKLWDIATGREVKTFSGHTGHVRAVMFSGSGKQCASSSDDGTTRLWDISTGKEIVRFISFTDGEWVVITPEGYFNASANGAKHLNVRVGNNVYSIDNFYEKFFNPVYVASVLQGKKVEAVADIRKGILTPPDVRITSPAPGSQFNTDTLTVTVAVKDTGGGIEEIRLYHNGKIIGEDQRGLKLVIKDGETVKDYNVTLVDGVNTFQTVGFSKDRTESNPYELVVKHTAPSKEVSLYVIAVGINTYKNPALNLNYAEPDARGIADFFKAQGRRLFKNVDIREIYNEQATKADIVSKLSQLQNTKPQDAVVIYLAGHGENINDKWYFIPHELTYPEREEDVKAKGISSDELSVYIRNIKAQKILLLLDACKAGAVLIAFRGFEDRKALSQLSRSVGVHIVAASTKDQFAAEVKDLGHGVFTYTLLEGLGGKAAGGGAVTVRKLMGYVEEQLPEITKKYKQEAQYPVVDSRGMDFPLVTAK